MAKGNSKRKNINGNDIELLVPAGGTEQFLAAVERMGQMRYMLAVSSLMRVLVLRISTTMN